MGGFDNETSRELSKNRTSHNNKFVTYRTKLYSQWKELGLDKSMTFLEFCKKNKKRKSKKT